MLAHRHPPPWTRAPPGPPTPTGRALALAAAAVATIAASACFTDNGATLTSAVELTSSTTTTGTTDTTTGTTADTATTGAADSSSGSTGAVSPTTGTGGESSTGECIDIWYLDIDGDSFGGALEDEGCGPPPPGYTLDSLDCDDSKPKVHPGAEELCDGLDNDCDLGVDEWPAASQSECNGCRAVLDDGHYYYFCTTPELAWDAAGAACKAMLADLVVVDHKVENQFLVDTGELLGLRWWIGLSDLALEGQFVWVDGQPLDPDIKLWANGEPNNESILDPGDANCVAIADELLNLNWRDQACGHPYPYICETLSF